MKSLSNVLLAILLCVTANADAKKAPDEIIRAKLEKLVPGVEPDSISATPVSGLYEVVYGARVLYFSQNGRYMIDGNLIDIDQRKDLTEQTRNGIRKATLDSVPEKQMIIFGPKNPKPHHHRFYRCGLHLLPPIACGNRSIQRLGNRGTLSDVSAHRCGFKKLRKGPTRMVCRR